MDEVNFNSYSKTLLFVSLLSFLVSYLYENVLISLSGILILLFLVFAKLNFKENIGDLEINRTIFEKLLFVNHPVNVKTFIKNNGGILKIRVKDILPENSEIIRGNNEIQGLFKSGEEKNIEYQLVFSTRGSNSYNETEILFEDRFGLFNLKTKMRQNQNLMIHSDPDEVKKAKNVSTRQHIDITIPSIAGAELSNELEGIREYSPGDPLKDIDWKSSSRLQKLMTKNFQKKETTETMILLDCSKSMRRTFGKTPKIEHTTTIAIQLSKILQTMRHPVGIIAYEEHKIIKIINPTKNHQRLFEELTTLPTTIKSNHYKIKKDIIDSENDKSESIEGQKFLSTIYPYLVRGKRKITHNLQATGIYEAVKSLLTHGNTKHIILITDMETNIKSIHQSLNLAHSKNFKIWLLTLFTPYYELSLNELNENQIEDLYRLQMFRDGIIAKLKKSNIEVVDLNPKMEAVKVIEKIRRKI